MAKRIMKMKFQLPSFVLGIVATVLATFAYFNTIGHFAHFTNLGVVCVW